MNKQEKAVYQSAVTLLKANNTVTTLEIKNYLRKQGGKWSQNDVSLIMQGLQVAGFFNYTDYGNYRIYSLPIQTGATIQTSKPQSNGRSISRTKAVDMIQNSKGHFFTVIFIKKDGSERTMNCQYSSRSSQSNARLGYVTVTETNNKTPKNVNTQTIKALSIGGTLYKVR